MVPNTSRQNNDQRWMALSLLFLIPRFLYNRIWLAKNTGIEEEKVQEAATPILKSSPPVIEKERQTQKKFKWSTTLLSGIGSVGKYAALTGSSVLFGETGVCGGLWEGLSWSTKIAIGLGIAYLGNQYLKGRFSGNHNTNTNTNTININLIGLDPKVHIIKEERAGALSITVQQEPKGVAPAA